MRASCPALCIRRPLHRSLNHSFNAGAGMAKTAYAASYIRDNMPMGVNYLAPLLTVQQAWDVSAFIISKPHPPATAETISTLE